MPRSSEDAPSEGDPGWNPALDLYRRMMAEPGGGEHTVEAAIAGHSFAIPTASALGAIAQVSPSGVVELGAGTGYWARLLSDAGVDVLAFDVAPANTPESRWFDSTEPWYPVSVGDEASVAAHPDRTLLLVWPTRDETWPADALDLFHEAGGSTVVYVGEPAGGRTGDDRFHARLGNHDHCHACAYGVVTVPCICDIEPQWERQRSVDLPRWPGHDDDLYVYVRRGAPSTTRRRWRPGRGRGRGR